MNQLVQQVQTGTERDDAVDWSRHLRFILDNRRLIASIALIVTLLGIAYALIARPIYEANILIQIEESVGSPRSALGEMSNLFDVKTGATSEMEILRSRMVVSRAVDNARLYIDVQPKYFPVIGAWVARYNERLSTPGLFGHGGYVWGAEQADVSEFNVPQRMEGKAFVLSAEGDDGFRLTNDENGIALRGRVGETARLRTRSGDIELRIDRLAAKPGAQFLLTRQAQLNTIEGLQDALVISERGKQSGIISVSLDGPDPQLTARVLNEVGDEYIRQNAARKSEEAEKSLAFLEKQLPAIKQELERAESKYNAARHDHGTVDLGEETKSMLQQSVQSKIKLADLKQKKEELLARFQEQHPEVVAINRQIQELNRELSWIDEKLKTFPAVEQEIFRQTRDVKVNTELYTSLLSAAQQLRLAAASKVGSARLLDPAATPVKPAKPKRLLVVVVAGMAGLSLGLLAAYVNKTLSGRIDNPREIEQLLGLRVSATIPYSESQKQLLIQNRSNMKKISVLPHDKPFDNAVESLRSFRSSLQFSMLNARNNIVMITGPTPGVGKSFVSANFASVLAAIGKKVLLVDGDLRTGQLHRYFGLERKNGLSDAIQAEIALDQTIHKNVVKNVDFISTGRLPATPAELLSHENFERILQLLSAQYDVVLIDTAPVLVVSDALVVGMHAGTIFNIVRGGYSTVHDIEETVRHLNDAGLTVTGTVFNDLKPRSNRYGYGTGYGKYRYVENA